MLASIEGGVSGLRRARQAVWVAVALANREASKHAREKKAARRAAKYGGMSFMLLKLLAGELP